MPSYCCEKTSKSGGVMEFTKQILSRVVECIGNLKVHLNMIVKHLTHLFSVQQVGRNVFSSKSYPIADFSGSSVVLNISSLFSSYQPSGRFGKHSIFCFVR